MNYWSKPRLLRMRKIEAAKRQIESAIWLWFTDADIVSVHTLTLAAHRILIELSKTWGVNPLPLTTRCFQRRPDRASRPVPEQPDVFFKQAKTEEVLELNETLTELFLFDAVMAYTNLQENDSASALMSTFVVRFGVQRPDLFAPATFSILEKKIGDTFNLERLEKLSKLEFLEEFFGVLGQPCQTGLAATAL